MSEKKSKVLPLIILVVFIVLAAGMFFAFVNERGEEIDSVTTNTLEEVAEDIDEAAELEGDEAVLADNDVDITTLNNNSNNVDIDLNAALQERILGNPDAPVKISEYSSFSCGHCGNFHKNVFNEFKTNWIDSGKAYLVFSDFPLNLPALHASLVGRCISDNGQYFDYVAEVYEKQSDWAFQSDHLAPLQEIASHYGIDDAMFKSCIQNEELQAGLLDKVRAAQQQFNVNSTPSFVINNSVTISGGASYAEFNKIVEDAVAQSIAPATEAPSDAPAQVE